MCCLIGRRIVFVFSTRRVSVKTQVKEACALEETSSNPADLEVQTQLTLKVSQVSLLPSRHRALMGCLGQRSETRFSNLEAVFLKS